MGARPDRRAERRGAAVALGGVPGHVGRRGRRRSGRDPRRCSAPSATSSRTSASATSAGGCRASSGSARRCGIGCRRAARPADLRPFAPIAGTGARGALDARGPALPPPRRARGHDLRARAPAARRHRRRGRGGRRDDRLSLLRRPRPARLRRRHRQPDRGRAARRGADRRRRRPRVRRRQLRGRPEVRARHGRLGRAVDRGAGGDHGPHQDRQRRDRRRRGAAQVAQVAGDDRGRRRGRAGDPARQHALRPAGRGRVRHLLHRLRGPAVGDRADARADVRRRAARRLRPAAGLLDRGHRDDVLRAHRGHARGPGRAAGGRRRRDRGRPGPSPATASSSLGIGSLRDRS